MTDKPHCFVAVPGSFFEVIVWMAWSPLHQGDSNCNDGMGTAVR